MLRILFFDILVKKISPYISIELGNVCHLFVTVRVWTLGWSWTIAHIMCQLIWWLCRSSWYTAGLYCTMSWQQLHSFLLNLRAFNVAAIAMDIKGNKIKSLSHDTSHNHMSINDFHVISPSGTNGSNEHSTNSIAKLCLELYYWLIRPLYHNIFVWSFLLFFPCSVYSLQVTQKQIKIINIAWWK